MIAISMMLFKYQKMRRLTSEHVSSGQWRKNQSTCRFAYYSVLQLPVCLEVSNIERDLLIDLKQFSS